MSKSTTTTPSNSSTTTTTTKSTTSAAKRPKHHHHHQHQEQEQEELQETMEHQPLLPGLPDHIAQLCLTKVQPSILYSVCKSWRRLIYSPFFPPFLSIYALLVPTQISSNQSHDSHLSNSIKFSSFDPISSKWFSLPPPPPDPPLRLLLRHPSFISRRFPIQSVSVSGELMLLAATSHHFKPALNRPLIFDPLSQNWSYGPPLAAPRRWCAAGSSACAVYVASGIGSHYNQEVARSVEKLKFININRNINQRRNKDCEMKWEKMGGLRDGKFSREAIDAVGWRGKLCMVNVKGDAAKEGIIYDVKNDSSEEMPEGMLAGWRGPAAAMAEETIYVVNESRGELKKYDPVKDIWVGILENEMLRGAQYAAAAGGKVCVVGGSGLGIVVVDVAALPARFWVVDSPPGFQAVAVHVLPRMSLLDFEESPVLHYMPEE